MDAKYISLVTQEALPVMRAGMMEACEEAEANILLIQSLISRYEQEADYGARLIVAGLQLLWTKEENRVFSLQDGIEEINRVLGDQPTPDQIPTFKVPARPARKEGQK